VLILFEKCVSFTKTNLLIVVSEIVKRLKCNKKKVKQMGHKAIYDTLSRLK